MSIQIAHLSLTIGLYITDNTIHQMVTKLLAKTQHTQENIDSDAALARQKLDLLIITSDLAQSDTFLAVLNSLVMQHPLYMLLIDRGGAYQHFGTITFDTISWPFDSAAFLRKVNGLTSLISKEAHLASQAQVLTHYHEVMIAEQTIARNIFSEFVKTDEIAFPEIKFYLSPMSTYNGDIILAAKNSQGRLHIVLGDFTGHGLSAAIGSIPMAEAFYTMVAKDIEPALIVREINKKLNKLLPSQMFCAACFIYFDPSQAQLSVWQGGMPTGYLFNEKNGEFSEVKSTQLPLGVLPDSEFDATFSQVNIAASTRLILFSDGFLEVKTVMQQTLSRSDITECISKAKFSEQITQLRALYQRYSQDQASLDDVSILAVQLCQ